MANYQRLILEVTLEALEVKVSGAKPAAGPRRHLVLASLVWPRPAIAQKMVTQDVTLDAGLWQRPAQWSRRILFKETVQGPCGIQLAVTEPLSDTALARMAAEMAGGAVKLLSSEMVRDMAAVPAGLVRLPFDSLQKLAVSLGKEDPRIVARGVLELPSAEAVGKTAEYTVPLVAPETLYRYVRIRRQGKTVRRRQSLLEKEQENGRANLQLVCYG